MTRSQLVACAFTVLAMAFSACTDDPADAGGGDSDGGGGSGEMDGGTAAGDADTARADVVLPDGATGVTQCTNGIDDDGDGEVDALDRECSGPADNDEASFATGIPGDNRDAECQDCFFDGNSGAGDDGCAYATTCLTQGDPSGGSGMCMSCDVTETCLREGGCRDATPNGCDCFGCCEVQLGDGSSVNILLGGTCSIEEIDDTSQCPRCIQSTECVNDCGRCELCLGRTVEDLPADCIPDGGVPMGTCDEGQQPCPDNQCPTGFVCQLGCCQVEII